MSTLAFTARKGRADGVRPRRKARPKESRQRRSPGAMQWPVWTDEVRYGVPSPRLWPAWTSEIRVATTKGRRPMEQAYATHLAPATIDTLILAALRHEARPVEEGELPDVCHLRYETRPAERAQSLARLIDRGLVTRTKLKKLNPLRPLFDFVEVTVYQAIGGDQ